MSTADTKVCFIVSIDLAKKIICNFQGTYCESIGIVTVCVTGLHCKVSGHDNMVLIMFHNTKNQRICVLSGC